MGTLGLMAFLLTMLGAALACGLEMLEALAIVLAVAATRRPRDAVLGALAALVACVAIGAVVGPALIGRVAGEPLRLVIGVALLLFGLEWLRKAILRLAGRRARSSSFAEFVAEREALEARGTAAARPARLAGAGGGLQGGAARGGRGRADRGRAGRAAGRAAPAFAGAAVALVATVGLGLVLHRPLRRLPETELKYLVGLVLTTLRDLLRRRGPGRELAARRRRAARAGGLLRRRVPAHGGRPGPSGAAPRRRYRHEGAAQAGAGGDLDAARSASRSPSASPRCCARLSDGRRLVARRRRRDPRAARAGALAYSVYSSARG